jgi:N-acetylglucosaminyldiphosphoundecaprenol N-acetyl-beta-D-mannosaminyltransferase
MNRSVEILGLRLPVLGGDEILQQLPEWAHGQERITILSGNAHFYNLIYELSWLRNFAEEEASAVRLDGIGVTIALRLLGYPAPVRATWADLAYELARVCDREKLSVFLLGSRPGVVERSADRLRDAAPGLSVAGVHHGYFDLRRWSEESREIISMIEQTSPDVLIVGMGMPQQERWLRDHRDAMSVPVVMTAGGIFDYISGAKRRPPKWMGNCGLEWLGRLLIEPRRLARRYVIGNPRFLIRILRQAIYNTKKQKGKANVFDAFHIRSK